MADYPSAYAKDDAALRLTSALNATKSRPSPMCTAARPGTVAPSVSDPPTRAPEGERHCIIVKGIEKSFPTGDKNDPDSIDTVVQIGWFQVLKGYIAKEWLLPAPTQQHEVLHRRSADERTY
jgi:hypothetical protein